VDDIWLDESDLRVHSGYIESKVMKRFSRRSQSAQSDFSFDP